MAQAVTYVLAKAAEVVMLLALLGAVLATVVGIWWFWQMLREGSDQ